MKRQGRPCLHVDYSFVNKTDYIDIGQEINHASHKAMNRIILLALLFICCYSLTIHAQSPWTRTKGSGYAQLSASIIPTYNSISDRDTDGQLSTARRISDNTLQAYLEYGLVDGTSLIAKLPFKVLASGDPSVSNSMVLLQAGNLSGFSNAELGIRQRIIDAEVTVAGQLKVAIPFSQEDTLTGLRTGFDSWSFVPMLSIGKGFGQLYGFVYSGVAIRTNGYNSYVNAGMEVGYGFADRLWVALVLDAVKSFENGTIEEDTALEIHRTGLYHNNQEYFVPGLKLFGKITDTFGATAAYNGGGFYAHRLPYSPSISLGIFVEWE